MIRPKIRSSSTSTSNSTPTSSSPTPADPSARQPAIVPGLVLKPERDVPGVGGVGGVGVGRLIKVEANGNLIPQFTAQLNASTNILEIVIYQKIGESFDWWTGESTGVSANSVKKELDSNPQASAVCVRINSPGGDAFEGIAILNVLRSQSKPVTVMIDGIAGSAASVVAMSGGAGIYMGLGSMLMIHRASGGCVGNDSDMLEMAQALTSIDRSIASVYAARTGKPVDEMTTLMHDVTWLTAEDAITRGFASGMQPEGARLPEPAQAQALALARKFKANVESIDTRMRDKKLAIAAMIRAGEPEPDPDPDRDPDIGDCPCNCANCADGKCSDCTNLFCKDDACVDCPMQVKAKAQVSEITKIYDQVMSGYRAHGYAEAAVNPSDPTGPILAIRSCAKLGFKALTKPVSNSTSTSTSTIGTITGLLAPYNSPSCDLGGFVEVFEPGCFTSYLSTDDPAICSSHDYRNILGRKSSGTARFYDESDGLHYDCDLPDTLLLLTGISIEWKIYIVKNAGKSCPALIFNLSCLQMTILHIKNQFRVMA